MRKEEQERPTVTGAEVEEILANSKRRYAVLFALLAGIGLRIGEALALKVSDLSPDGRVLYVRRSIWGGKEQLPKTPNAVREVDIDPLLARLLKDYAAGKAGYIFDTATGTALQQRNVLGRLHEVKRRASTLSADFAPRYCGGRVCRKTSSSFGLATRSAALPISMRMD